MKTMKRLFSLVIILTMFALTACGAPNPQKPAAGNPGAASEGEKQITVAANGGIIEKQIREVVAPKFKEKYGIKVIYIAGVSGEILSKVELQKNNPQIDVAIYVPLDVVRANDKGLLEEIDSASVTNVANVNPQFFSDGPKTSVPIFGYTIAPLYNVDVFKKNGWAPISSWNDLIRPEYKGKTAYSDVVSDYGFAILYNLAKSNGGSLDNMEPGLKKAKELAGYSNTFYKTTTQMIPAFQQGAADVGVMGSYATQELANSGIPVKMIIPKEGAPLQAFSGTIVKNTTHKKEAEQFLNFIISEEMQTQISEGGAFYPVGKGMKIASKYEESIGLKPTDNVFSPDNKKLAEIRGTWADRWTKEATPELGKLLSK
jgi:putative spermidine/putrescine transport system substrate-binding protein